MGNVHGASYLLLAFGLCEDAVSILPVRPIQRHPQGSSRMKTPQQFKTYWVFILPSAPTFLGVVYLPPLTRLTPHDDVIIGGVTCHIAGGVPRGVAPRVAIHVRPPGRGVRGCAGRTWGVGKCVGQLLLWI